jgi:hypothetical protein
MRRRSGGLGILSPIYDRHFSFVVQEAIQSNPTQPSQPDMRIFLVMLWIMHVWTTAAKTTSQL